MNTNPDRSAVARRWASLAGALLIVAAGAALASGALPGEGGGGPAAARAGGGANPFGEAGTRVVEAIQATEGCLGVEFVSTASGKQAIFAWFRDKDAVIRFYASPAHRAAMERFFPDRPAHEPLAQVPDGTGPILAIASITPMESPNAELGGLPIRQISIELLTPLPGGLDFGGTFAPKGAKARAK
jgi:hypothetical protein